ncbi:MAG: MerR family transcriptional regulator [Saezia sp.]
MATVLPPIPKKRYFTIGEVSELCGVKPHVLRYWEQEFTQLRPIKRRGNRRYYQHHEVLLVRRIRDLLYEQGFTISGARQQLTSAPKKEEFEEDLQLSLVNVNDNTADTLQAEDLQLDLADVSNAPKHEAIPTTPMIQSDWHALREELLAIRRILEED